MATETLVVPEEHLREVIEVIRAGLEVKKPIHPVVRRQLRKWCNEMEEYLESR